MDKRQFAFQKDGCSRSVVDDDVWICLGDYLIIFSLVIPDPQFRHFDGRLRHLSFVPILSGQIEVDVSVQSRVRLAHDDALQAVRNVCALVFRVGDTLDNLLPFWVGVEPVIKF